MFQILSANQGHVALVQPHRFFLLYTSLKNVSSKVVRRGLGRPKLMCTSISKFMCTNIIFLRQVCQHCVALKTGKRSPFYLYFDTNYQCKLHIQPLVGKRPPPGPKLANVFLPQIWGAYICTYILFMYTMYTIMLIFLYKNRKYICI